MEKYFIVLDTETTNSLDDPLCYDIGFAVVNENGKVFEKHSYVVAEIFLNKELMESAYFKEKIPQYWKDIKNGKRLLYRLNHIRLILKDTMERYKTKIVVCHNARFDYISLATTQRFLTKSKYRYFLPYNTEIWCTLKMSRQVFKNSNKYKSFCESNNYLTFYKKPQLTAEIIYRYLNNNTEFEESHTGLEDVLIEKDILAYCIQNGIVNGRLWE